MSQKKSKIIIELWGQPGVGKTTLAEKLVSDYGFTRIVHREKKFKYPILTAKYPLCVLSWALVIFKDFLKVKDFEIFRYNISLLFSALQRIDDATSVPETRLVLDEGLMQRFLSCSDSVHNEKLVKYLIKLSPLANYVILVNDREVTSDRYEDSSHLRTQRGGEYLSNWRKNLLSNITVVYKVTKKLKIPHFWSTKENSIDAIIEEIERLTLSKS